MYNEDKTAYNFIWGWIILFYVLFPVKYRKWCSAPRNCGSLREFVLERGLQKLLPYRKLTKNSILLPVTVSVITIRDGEMSAWIMLDVRAVSSVYRYSGYS